MNCRLKKGRPTDHPRPYKVSIRINDERMQILEKYCIQESVKKTDAIERGIWKLKGDLKKIKGSGSTPGRETATSSTANAKKAIAFGNLQQNVIIPYAVNSFKHCGD